MGLRHGECNFKIPGGKDGPEYLGMSAVFDIVVEEEDHQRTVDERRLLHRARWTKWVKVRLFSACSICSTCKSRAGVVGIDAIDERF